MSHRTPNGALGAMEMEMNTLHWLRLLKVAATAALFGGVLVVFAVLAALLG